MSRYDESNHATDDRRDDIQIQRVKRQLSERFGHSDDLALIPVRIRERDGLLCYLTTLTNSSFMMDHVVRPLTHVPSPKELPEEERVLESLRELYMGGLACELLEEPNRLAGKLIRGYAALLIDGEKRALLMNVKELERRPVGEPTTQNVVKGPKESFTESAETNRSMIRRRISNEKLRFEKFEIGRKTHTAVYLTYIEGEADGKILRQIRERLQTSRMVSLFDSGSMEEILRPKGLLLFPSVYNSERPDSVCSCLMDKRIAIIVDGSPFVLVVPALLTDFFKSPEDQYQWFVFGAFVRFMRYVAFLFSLCLPALFVAVTSYHQELIPTLLVTSIAAQREGIPFPAVVEIFMMEITFELLREAGTRMPRLVGQSISIAGAIVLGEAAVQAGVVSNITVIIVALTTISGFVSPVYSFGANIRLFRYALIVLGSLLGLYGVIVGCAFLLIHLTRIEIFGVPYLSPLSRLMGRRAS